jgi:hypothetical protein
VITKTSDTNKHLKQSDVKTKERERRKREERGKRKRRRKEGNSKRMRRVLCGCKKRESVSE